MAPGTANDVKRFAIEDLGFNVVGISPAEPPSSAPRLTTWLAAGRHGDMRFMSETAAVRADLQRFLPGARAVVCVGMSYHEAGRGEERRPGTALVARYARRRDYHDVIRPRLLRLGAFIGRLAPGSAFRVAVDTAPVLEKALAARAGLGWIGRNTLLINRELGSEVLLGEVVTTADIEADGPAPDLCGACRACLDACPTRALVAPWRLDARRCVSYLTIEHAGPLPTGSEPSISPYLAGCDACQLACPWNHAAALRTDPALAPRPELERLAIASLAGLDAEGWRRLFAGTPLRRLGHARVLRNLGALVAAGSGEARRGRGP